MTTSNRSFLRYESSLDQCHFLLANGNGNDSLGLIENEYQIPGFMNRSRFRFSGPGILLAGFLLASQAIASEDEIETTLERWVETRKQIVEEENRWREDEAHLRRTRELLESELRRLDESIDRISAETAAQSRERERLTAENEAQDALLDAVAGRMQSLETSLVATHARFPDPLRELTRPLRLRLPRDSDAPPPLTRRAQTVVGLLGEADRFQESLHTFREVIPLPEGETREVRTLYLGLGQAFYLSSDGDRAGVGRPGDEGWEWSSRPDLAREIRRAFSVYDNETAPDFVRLPVTLETR